MNIWFVIWVFIATFILGTSVWSYAILLRQKKAWQVVSDKLNLRYTATATFKSASLKGILNGFEIDVYADQPLSGKFRDGGSRTIIELTLKAPMPTQGVIGSMSFKNFMDGMALLDKYAGEGALALSPEVYNRVRKADDIKDYFTKERVATLNSLMTLKLSPSLLIFSPDLTLLRIESTDPFDDPVRFEKFLTRVGEAAKIISL